MNAPITLEERQCAIVRGLAGSIRNLHRAITTELDIPDDFDHDNEPCALTLNTYANEALDEAVQAWLAIFGLEEIPAPQLFHMTEGQVQRWLEWCALEGAL